MIELVFQDYFIEICSDQTYTVNSSDNARNYNKKYIDCGHTISVQYGITIKNNNQDIDSAILSASGGSTSPHDRCAVIDNDNLIVIIGDNIINLSLPDLTLNWRTGCDNCSTCFELYMVDKGYLIHGETSIVLVNQSGAIQWEFSGRDIFVTPDGKDIFSIQDGIITVNDWDYNIYRIGMDGKEIK